LLRNEDYFVSVDVRLLPVPAKDWSTVLDDRFQTQPFPWEMTD